MKKISIFIVMILLIFSLSSCDRNDDYEDDQEINENNDDELLSLTLEELALYDGKDGNMAYIAVNGVIYDVTDEWNNGSHNGQNAGNDMTNVISNAPHGESILDDLEVVGSIVE